MEDILNCVFQVIENYRTKVHYAGATNHIVKRVKALTKNTKPNPQKLFVIEGIWAFNMAFKANLEFLDFIVCPECIFSKEALELAQKAAEAAKSIHVVSKKVLEKISERDKPDGLIAISKLPEVSLQSINTKNAIIVILDAVEIPGNIGTILRSCDGANIDAVFICNKRARLTHPKIVKGSMGAVFFMPIIVFESVTECKAWLSKNGFTIYLADTRAEKLYCNYTYKNNTALVVGSERYGITKEWYQDDPKLIAIPMMGKCDSLNVAIATTVVIYEMRLKKLFKRI